MDKPLNAEGKALARSMADGMLKYSKTADEAEQKAYRRAMHSLDHEGKRMWRITDLAQEMVEAEAKDYFKNKETE